MADQKIKVYICDKEEPTLSDPGVNLSVMAGRAVSYKADVFLNDEKELVIRTYGEVRKASLGLTRKGSMKMALCGCCGRRRRLIVLICQPKLSGNMLVELVLLRH